MITRTSRAPKRIAATAAAVAMVGSVLAISGSAAVAGPGAAAPSSDRLAGDLRYGTAAEVADDLNANGGDISTITVADGLNFPDGLASAFLDQAILLTETGSLPADTVAWLEANNAAIANIQIVGETMAVSAAVEAQLRAYGEVTRLGGPNRYDTAVEIAESEAPNTTEIIIARGDDFPDALASGPLSIAADAPIILNAGATLRSEVTTYLDENAQITSAYIVGGETAVPATVAAALVARGITVERLGGANRDATAVEVANELQTLGDYDDGVILANRLRFADAMVSGPLGGQRTLPILLVAEASIPQATADYHVANCLTIAEIVAVGGTDVINQSVIDGAVAAATCDTASNQTFAVTPQDDVSLVAVANPDSTTTDNRSFTVSGLDSDTETFRVTLVVCENISVDANGVVSFAFDPAEAEADGDNLASTGSPTTDILTVNGAPASNNGMVNTPGTSPKATTTAVNGSITFTIDGDGVECVVPVVYYNGGAGMANADGGSSPRLELDANGVPVEPFGIGGQTTFTNPLATTGATAGLVQSVNKDANQFDANNLTFTFDANDTFQIGGVPATLDEFKAALSSGDSVDANFSANPAASSSFNLTDANPAQPAPPTTSVATSNDVTVTATVAGDKDSVIFQRATVVGGTAGTFATIATVTSSDAATQAVFLDSDVPAGTYQYRVIVVNDGDQSLPSAPSANTTTTAPGPDTNAPDAIDTVSTQNAGLAGDLGAGDAFKVVFDEALAAPSATATFRLDDNDTTIADLVNGQNATFTVNAVAETVNGVSRPAGTVLTVNVTGAPIIVVPGTVAGVQLPADIVAAGGVTDAAGNQFNPLAGGQDVTIEQIGADTQNNSADMTPAVVTVANPAAGATTVVFTSNEAVQAGSVTTADFGGTATVTGVSVSANGLTITATTNVLVAGQTVILNATSILDLAGNPSPAADVTATTTA